MRQLLFAVIAFGCGIGIGIAAVPKALDPVEVAPHIYELAFENDRVRVLKRTIRHGETTPLIAQPDRVVIYLNPCAWMETTATGDERMQDFKFGEPAWAPAGTHGGHTATVIQTCHVLEIELL
ncbi:MAG: hypothetical protein R3288_01565 [Woeseiaceae bacterium]|nr:hypothetical protein [Woeseiaceae bacterium]